MDHKKQNISLRMNSSDLRKIKQIAVRLQARDSDVFRFAIKMTLTKLAPLHEANARGNELVPAFTELGSELAKYFELDSERLNRIINEGVEDPLKRVEWNDIELLALAGMDEHYIWMKLRKLASPVNGDAGGPNDALRTYLLEKYVRGV